MAIIREGVSYGLVGLLQLALDALCFVALTSIGINPVAANLCSRLAGAAVGFWTNGSVTFASSGSSKVGRTSFIRYAVTWGLTAALSTAAVSSVGHFVGIHWAQAAKPVVDGILAIAAFLCSKYWIYA